MLPRRYAQPYLLMVVPEFVPRDKIRKSVECVYLPLGRSPVLGVAIAHQELMLLTPFLEFTRAVVDAATWCLLMQCFVKRHGMAVLEQNFAT